MNVPEKSLRAGFSCVCVCVGGGGGSQSAYLCDTQGFLERKIIFARQRLAVF